MIEKNIHFFAEFINMSLVYYILAFLLGCVAASAELLSRYTEGPSQLFKLRASYAYMFINGMASVLAFKLILDFDIQLGTVTDSMTGKVLLAGFSAMVVLRSSVASIKKDGKTIEAGLASITQIFLNVADRAYDRERSQVDLKLISAIMKDVDFEKAAKDLPATCLNVMQGLSEDESKKLGEQIQELKAKGEFDSNVIKSVNLGVILARVTGINFLKEAVDTLGDLIKTEGVGEAVIEESDKQKIEKLMEKFK